MNYVRLTSPHTSSRNNPKIHSDTSTLRRPSVVSTPATRMRRDGDSAVRVQCPRGLLESQWQDRQGSVMDVSVLKVAGCWRRDDGGYGQEEDVVLANKDVLS